MRLILILFLMVGYVDVRVEAGEKVLPNIVFIMADDMGVGDLGCYNGKSKIPTPHMDRLAKEGMRFTDAHSPSAVCTPTRYGVLTGRYCWRSKLKRGVLWGYSAALIEDRRLTVSSMLKGKGYVTGVVGKWHLGFGTAKKTDYSKPLRPGPTTQGFDYFYGIPASLDMQPYVYVENDRPVEQPTETVKGSRHRRQKGGGFWRGGPVAPSFKHIDVMPVITEKAVSFIERRAKDKGKPFFLYFPLSAPHTPWLPTKAFRGKTKVGYYGDFTAQVDWTIGEVLKALDRTGLAGNTMVIVTSDNGSHWPVGDVKKYGHAANLHYRGQKADIWEGGHRVPFIVRWPGKVKAGSISEETICLTDLTATAAAMAGYALKKGEAEDSFNILPAMLGEKLSKPIRDATVHHSLTGMFAIRMGDWKLIEGRGSGGFTRPQRIPKNKLKKGEPVGQLYNLKDDPSEKKNLYGERKDVVKKLTDALKAIRESGSSRY